MKLYQTGKPFITTKEKQYVLEVLSSGNLSLGPKYRQFEQRFARTVGTRYACAITSSPISSHIA